MQKVAALALCFFLGGCAHWGEKEKTLGAIAVGAVSGAIISAAVGSIHKDIDQEKAMPTNALIGAAAGGAYALFFMKDEEAAKRAELEKKLMEQAESAGGGYKMGDLRRDEAIYKDGCYDTAYVFCSAADGTKPTHCAKPETIRLSRNFAVRYQVLYSPSGCIRGDEKEGYSVIPDLEKYFHSVFSRKK